MASLPYPLNLLYTHIVSVIATTQSAVHSYCQCDCHHSIGLYTHVCVGMAGMPYPPTDTHSSVFKKPVLLFFCLFKNNMFSCPIVFSNNNMFSCSLVFLQQHVLLFFCLFKQQHVLMSSCLQNNNMFFCLSPKRTISSIQSCLYVAKKKRLRATLPAVKP